MAGQIVLWVVLVVAWLSTLLGLPGTAIMLLAAGVYGWATGFHAVTLPTLGCLAAIALPAEVLDQVLGIWASRRFGASWLGMVGGFAGGVGGAALLGGVLPLVGVVPGALLGAFAGAFLAEYAKSRDAPAALHAAWGSFLGRIAGIALKMSAGALMLWVIYLAR